MCDKKINILLVDDRPENLLTLEAVLTSRDYNLVRAYSGEDALRCVLKEDFALILLDVQMPGLDGFETARLIRLREKYKNVPIVFITAINQANEFVVQGYKLGATDYIIKPFHPDTLKLKIELYVKVYRDRENLEKLVQERTADLLLVNKQLQQEVIERKKVSERLMESNEKNTNILESITDAFLTLDKHWRYSYMNKEAERIWGRQKQELLGKVVWEDYPQLINSEYFKQLHKAVKDKISVHFEEYIQAHKIWIEFHVYPSNDGGLSIYFRDLSEHKKYEQEMLRLDRLNLIGQMAAGIGHEVRNPMTTVRGFLQLLQGKPACQQYNNYFGLMIEELDRANSIITEFLSLARHEHLNLQRQNINNIIETLYPLILADAMKSDIQIKLQLSEVPDLLLDEKGIRQVLLNLVRNGLEAMEEGKTITIKTYTEKDNMVLAVQDEGGGIPENVLDKLGTPFLTTKDQGTGLGLAVCYGIVSKHNAILDVDTGLGGTTFSMRFKLEL